MNELHERTPENEICWKFLAFSNHDIASRGAAFYWQMSTAWMVLLVEPLHGVTFALAWTAAIDFVKKPEVSGRITRVMKLLFVDCRVFRCTGLSK